MNPGELNCRVIILRATETRDNEGHLAVTYDDHMYLWAKIQAITARSRDSYVEQNFETLTRITIRYRDDVFMTDRIKYGSRIFAQIGPPINLGEKNAYLRLECREIVEKSHG